MCLISLAIDRHVRFPLVIAANRDERFARPAAPLDWWPDGGATPQSVSVLGGRDLASGGTWLALGSNARMAMLTNVRDPSRLRALAPSRGSIVPGWIASTHRAAEFWTAWAAMPHNPFNLLAADFTERASGQWWWADDRRAPVALGTGIHGLSNAGLATPWPKVRRLDAAMAQALNTSDASPASIECALFAALADRSAVADADLPDTGIGLARERMLGTAFISLPGADAASAYGTRCSTVLIVEREAGRCTARLVERSFDVAGSVTRQRAIQCMPWPLIGATSPVVDEDFNSSRAPSPGARCPPLRTARPAA